MIGVLILFYKLKFIFYFKISHIVLKINKITSLNVGKNIISVEKLTLIV